MKPAFYRPLHKASSESEDSDVDFHIPLYDQSKAHTSLTKFSSTVIALLAILFVTTNSVWAVLYLRRHQGHFSFTSQAPDATHNTKDSSYCMQQPSNAASIYLLAYSGHPDPPFEYIIQPFHQISDFNTQHAADKNATDRKWRDLFPNGNGLASLPHSLAREKGLPITAADPLNDENGVYLLAGFHHLHCLTVLRSSLWHFKLGEEQSAQWHHITHCMDTIRQSLMCDIDTTLLWTTDLQIFGDGQSHTCKDYWGLNAWLADNRAYD